MQDLLSRPGSGVPLGGAAPGGASKWKILSDTVAPSGLRIGLEAATQLAAKAVLLRALRKSPYERDAADLRCVCDHERCLCLPRRAYYHAVW